MLSKTILFVLVFASVSVCDYLESSVFLYPTDDDCRPECECVGDVETDQWIGEPPYGPGPEKSEVDLVVPIMSMLGVGITAQKL